MQRGRPPCWPRNEMVGDTSHGWLASQSLPWALAVIPQMPTEIETDGLAVLEALVDAYDEARAASVDQITSFIDANELAERTGLTVERLNDAIAFLELHGYVELFRHFGTAPYDFGSASLTALGRF